MRPRHRRSGQQHGKRRDRAGRIAPAGSSPGLSSAAACIRSSTADGRARDAERALTVAELPHGARLGGQGAPQHVVALERHGLAARARPPPRRRRRSRRRRRAPATGRSRTARPPREAPSAVNASIALRYDAAASQNLSCADCANASPATARAVHSRSSADVQIVRAALVESSAHREPRRDELGDGRRLQHPADVRQVADRFEVAAALFVAGARGIEVAEPEVHVADALRHRRRAVRGRRSHPLVGADGVERDERARIVALRHVDPAEPFERCAIRRRR